MGKFGIIAAMKVEIELLLGEMTEIRLEKHAGADFYSGKISGCEVVLAECGIGKVNAALHTQAMIDRFNAGMIINTGIAGGISPKLSRMSVVLSDRLTYHDVDRGQAFSVFPDEEWFYADRGMVNIISGCAERHPYRVIATGDRFISSSEVKDRIYRELDALCVDMEGAAVAHVAHLNGIPFAVIRCISDMADEGAAFDFFEFERTASNRSADIVVKALPNLIKTR
jgi:adenosylhomocysteine nucleosidase